MSFFKRLGRALGDLFTSKKAIMSAATAVAGVVGRKYGWDETQTATVVAAGIGYVIAQGKADQGKEAEKKKVQMHSDAELAERLAKVREGRVAGSIESSR